MRDIPGYENLYAITTNGRVWSNISNRWLKQHPDQKGYMQLGLYKNKKARCFWVARLVMMTYAKPHRTKKYIDHINGIKTDNRIENLQWVTLGENVSLAWKRGNRNHASGEQHGHAKLTEIIVKSIRERYAGGGIFRRELATEYGVARQTIDDIINRRIWG